ncbi:unnamed protein product [Penicillium salamii]|nr:unnamed protein product [Penicillium salamii]CAG8265039.1 unnamed protein product [Penicillium salamii]
MLPFNLRDSGKRENPTPRQHIKRTINGPPKALHLPQLCKLDGASSVLLIRQQSPWNKYKPVLKCDIAGKVIIATQRSNPSRVQAVREYSKSGAENLIQRFNCLRHANILSSRDCYIDSNHLYAFVDDFPLTLGNLVSAPGLYPTEVEMAAIMSQCSECSPNESQTKYLKALPAITMELMQKYEKDAGVAGVDDLNRWPVGSDTFGFLSAASTKSLASLRVHPLVASSYRPTDDLVMLARAILCAGVATYTHEIGP